MGTGGGREPPGGGAYPVPPLKDGVVGGHGKPKAKVPK